MNPKKATDIILETPNPKALDGILNQFGAALIQNDTQSGTYLRKDGGYVVRCFSDPGFIKFVIQNQGYATFVKELPELV